ncbi:transglycosylase SLT domain-containing protein [Methylocystis heyeri]|uniref:Transglycosylase SLT domain-containing protein n=2 Tax=Methylocystis heyeri TaxID=391905 RepID=A0A6B8KK75_9HYPH|nr:transglycosylase SLT domain-containing protein [Methylocystis heyeri]
MKESSIDPPWPFRTSAPGTNSSCAPAGSTNLLDPPSPSPDGGDSYFELIHREAGAAAMPADLAYAVAFVESGFNPEASGDVGEVGLMQVRPQTAAMLGFRGTNRELATPGANVRYGVAYLAEAWRLAEGDLCRTLMKYRAGHGEERMTARSVEYCARAKDYLKRIGSSLGARSPVAPASVRLNVEQPRRSIEIKTAERKSPRPTALRFAGLSGSDRFWAMHEARIRAMKERVYAKWRQMAHRHARERIASRT